MGKPIEDIRGPIKSEPEQVPERDSFFSKDRESIPSFSNPPLRTFEDNQKNEIHAIDSEISSNPFLMRYANHTGPTDYGRLPRQGRRKGGKKNLWIAAALVFLFALVSLSYAFAKATILVTPKTFAVELDDTFTASYQAENGFSFEKMSVENTESGTVTSSGSSASDLPATGRVILYNEYSTTKQNLLINTRLEAPDGKIYMTDTAISIPGYTKQGTTVVPGQVEVGIHAEKGGAEYNKDKTDFIIFGWKNDPAKKDKFYARSTTPITGGSSGLVYTISNEEYNAKMTELDAALRQKITNQIYAEVPDGFFTFPDAIMITETERSYAKSAADVAVPLSVSMKGTAFIFAKQNFADAVRTKKADSLPIVQEVPLEYRIGEADTALFALSSESKDTAVTTLSFNVKGQLSLVAIYDKNALLSSLLGEKTKNTGTILEKNEAIESLKVKMRPPWKQSFPSSPEDIELLEAKSTQGVDL